MEYWLAREKMKVIYNKQQYQIILKQRLVPYELIYEAKKSSLINLKNDKLIEHIINKCRMWLINTSPLFHKLEKSIKGVRFSK